MKLMMKKWIMRPLTLTLALILAVLTPAGAWADETGAEGTKTSAAEEILSGYTLTASDGVWTGDEVTSELSLVSEDTSAETPAYSISDVTYKNNTAVGTASVTATVSVEGYEGSVTKEASFDILPVQATGTEVTGVTKNTLTAVCDPMPEAMTSGSALTWSYRFELLAYNSTDAAWETVEGKTVDSSANEATFEGLYTAHNYRVAAYYVAAGDKEYAGAASEKAFTTTEPAVTKASAVKNDGTSMTVTWKAVNRASGYEVDYSTGSAFNSYGTVKIEDGSVTSAEIELATNYGYYVRVRAYRTVYGVTTYGGYSDTAFTSPETPAMPSFTARTTSTLTLSCNASETNKCVYQFRLKKYDSDKKAWVTAKTLQSSTPEVQFTGLDAGRKYKAIVRYGKKCTADGTYHYGAWSEEKTVVTTPAKVNVTSVTKTAKKKMKVTWKSSTYGTGYQIQYSISSDTSKGKTVTVEKRSASSKSISLPKNATYHARVRAYVTLDGKKIYGAWSKVQSTYYSCVYYSFTTYYSSSNKPRTNNLQRACSEINGTILSPGEEFSFNEVVGPRTAARGYQEAIVYSGGQEIPGMGGGICQVCTTLFNCALRSNMTILERHCHSMTVHYIGLGYDAAMAGTAKTLRFRNNSGVTIKIYAKASGGKLTMKFLCNTYKKAPKVTTKVTVKNKVYTLKRYYKGVCNYTTTSYYSDI